MEKFDYNKWKEQLRNKMTPKPAPQGNVVSTLLNKAKIKRLGR